MVITWLQNFIPTQFVFCEILVQEVQLQHIFIHVHLQKCRNWNEHILQLVSWILMIFGQEENNTKMNKPGKFHPNPMYDFRENDHHNLRIICIFIEICDVGFSDFWCGDALEWKILSCKISAKPSCILWNTGSGILAATHLYSCLSTKVQKLKWVYIAIGKLDSHDFWIGSA